MNAYNDDAARGRHQSYYQQQHQQHGNGGAHAANFRYGRARHGHASDAEAASEYTEYDYDVAQYQVPGISMPKFVMIRNFISLAYMFLGLLSIYILGSSDDPCIKMSRQFTAPEETIGHAATRSVSRGAGEVCPVAVNMAAMFIAAFTMLGTTSVPCCNQIFIEGLDRRRNYLMWVPFGIQGAMIFMILLIFAGTIGFYELIYATIASMAIFGMFYIADEINAMAMVKRDLLDFNAKKGTKYTQLDFERSTLFRDFFVQPHFTKPLPQIVGCILHALMWIFAYMQFVQSITSKNDLSATYVTSFVLVSFIQMAIPFFVMFYTYADHVPGPPGRWFRQYRNMCITIDIAMFFCHLFLSITFFVVG